MNPDQVNQISNRIINTLLPKDQNWALTVCAVLFAKVIRATDFPEDKAHLMLKQTLAGTKKANSGIILPGI